MQQHAIKLGSVAVALGAMALVGCAHKDFKTGFKEKLVTQAQEDLSCPDVSARKVKGPDKPSASRFAVWSVKGCGKEQSYSSYCLNDLYLSCNFMFADEGKGFGP